MTECMATYWYNYGGWAWDFWRGEFMDYDAFAYSFQACKIIVEFA